MRAIKLFRTTLTSETLDYLRYQSDMLYEHAVRLSPLGCDRVFSEIIPKLRELSTIIYAQDSEKEQWSNFRLSKYYSENCGRLKLVSIYTLSDLGVLSNLIGSLSLANGHYSPLPSE